MANIVNPNPACCRNAYCVWAIQPGGMSVSVPELGPASASHCTLVSRIQVEAPLDDESQLFTLLADMRERGGGVFVMRNCILNRSAGSAESGHAGLTARCALDFLTVTDSAGATATGFETPAPGG